MSRGFPKKFALAVLTMSYKLEILVDPLSLLPLLGPVFKNHEFPTIDLKSHPLTLSKLLTKTIKLNNKKRKHSSEGRQNRKRSKTKISRIVLVDPEIVLWTEMMNSLEIELSRSAILNNSFQLVSFQISSFEITKFRCLRIFLNSIFNCFSSINDLEWKHSVYATLFVDRFLRTGGKINYILFVEKPSIWKFARIIKTLEGIR